MNSRKLRLAIERNNNERFFGDGVAGIGAAKLYL
jgi:hypothetical protein